MEIFFYLLARLFYYLIGAVEICLLIRAVLSWFPGEFEGAFIDFLYTVTETVVAPMRFLLERFESVRQSPIDLSFFATVLVLSFVQIGLQAVI